MLEANTITWERERLLEALEAYHRGTSDAPVLRKWSQAEVQSPDVPQDQSMTFVLSTDEVDRHGDVVVAEGWKLESYRSNPVFLWAHDYARPVIGRAEELWTEAHRLIARMEFAPTQFAQEVATLYRGGYQRGVSVGFKPIRFEERRQEKTGAFLGIRFLEQELLEASAVPIPANRNALRRGVRKGPQPTESLSSPHAFPAALEALWPTLAARIDELDKLAGELAQSVADLNGMGASQPLPGEAAQVDLAQVDVAQVMEALRSFQP